MLPWALFALLTLIATPLLAAPVDEVVREQRSFMINGAPETWRLIWRGTPSDSNSCGPANPAMALTCPCSGVAYAQTGDLALERARPGAPPERMALTPLFAGSDMLFDAKGTVAMLPRWRAQLSDIDNSPTPAAIAARPPVPIMRLRDYNHDGIAGEFLLQINTLPCGKHLMVAVGITRDNPRLHALTTAEHPERALALYPWQWQALARNPGPATIMDWPCGDHAADEETTMLLRTDHGRIHATRITSTCPDTPDAQGIWHHQTRFHKRVVKREVL
jgi:hypothetical protein